MIHKYDQLFFQILINPLSLNFYIKHTKHMFLIILDRNLFRFFVTTWLGLCLKGCSYYTGPYLAPFPPIK